MDDAAVRPGGRSMLELLEEDHHQLRQLCDRLAAAPADQRLIDVLVATLSRHLSAEEQYLYPTVRAVLPDGGEVADREVAADGELLRALRLLERDPALLAEVDTHVRHHVERASRQVFPGLRTACSGNELIRLGNRVQIAREAAPTRPHPATPQTPPLNKLVDPAVGAIDKVRDALTRRTTWPEDL
jgi:hypothetical protein